jgi:hypothetical protein
MARQHEDGSFDSVEADRLSEEMRVRCLATIERYRAEHGTAPNGLLIETTAPMLATTALD